MPGSSLLGRDKREAIATIGSFDGVHRGHQCLLGQVRHIADERKLKAMAITFGASPKRVLGMIGTSQLTSTEERTTRLRQQGMDEVAMLDFTSQMAEMSARDFMQQILKEQLHVKVLVIGYDHRFGRGRSEGFDDYVRYGKEIGIKVVRGEVCTDGGEPISSTRIRNLLTEGNVNEATRLLGYPYTLHGKVISGYREGRKMGFPTANIHVNDTDKLTPADGVYAVYVNVCWTTDNRQQTTDNSQFTIDEDFASGRQVRSSEHDVSSLTITPRMQPKLSEANSRFKGMLNIGYRPTLNNGRERSIEVHILDFEGDLYGKTIMVEFIHRLREERTFASLEELTEQLQKDKKRVVELLTEE